MTATIGDAVDGRDGPSGTLAGTREAVSGRSMGYMLVRLSRLSGLAHTTRLVPIGWVAAGAGDGVTLDASRAVLNRLGEIDLSGELPTESARETATALAMAVPGVTQVHIGAKLPFVAAAVAA